MTSHTDIRTSSPTRRAILKSFAGGAVGAAFLAAGWAVEAAAPRANVEMGGAPDVRTPVKLIVVYGQPEDEAIFESYYRTTHIPLARRVPYCAAMESALAVSDAAGEKASFYRIATLTFDSESEMVACMSSEAGQAAFADIANFATGGATATIVNDVQAYQLQPSAKVTRDVPAIRGYDPRSPD